MKTPFAITCALLSASILCGCGSIDTPEPPAPVQIPNTVQNTQIAEGEELFALAENEEEAKKIAELYGISLVDFSYGVASFHTDEDLSAVIKRGKDNNWPLIEVNYLNHAN